MENQNQFKKFKVLGLTTDFNVCDCCGKENLNKTIAILDLNYGIISHFGTTCAASIDKYDSLEAAKLAKKDISSAVRKFEDTERFAKGVCFKLLKAKFGLKPVSEGQDRNRSYTEALNVDISVWQNTVKAAVAHYLQTPFIPFKI